MKNKEQACCQAMHGWQVKKTYDISIPKATVLELEHIKTGARYIHVSCDSKENVFAVAFKTVSTDNTGVAHILEHTVLTGSEKYPVRDPFFSMIKRSLNTFMNAFTSNDWTAYPFASPNKKDFYNLMSVYLDAAFFPKISKLNFSQEGWRYSFNGEKLQYDGVVYNEMKGSMSSVDRQLEESIMTNLYAEAPYHFNYGGNPKNIPDLSHKELVKFHKKFYHPSNAYFYSYGDLSLSDHLLMINKNVLDYFDKSGELIEIKAETRWAESKEAKAYYSANKDDRDSYQVTLSWLTCHAKDNLDIFGLELLEDILLANSASPLKKVLLDSDLGTDLSDSCGYNSELLDTKFSVGLKGVKEKDINKVADLIVTCLQALVEKGIDQDLITAAIRSNEIRKKDISNHPYPYGLQVFLNVLPAWLHGGDVSEVVNFEKLFQTIKDKVEQGGYFESLIRKYLLDNKHRLDLVLAPDEQMQSKIDSQEKERLETVGQELSDKKKKEISGNFQALSDLQTTEEDLSCLPSLELGDINQEIEIVEKAEISEKDIVIYSKNTNGLLYFTNTFDTSGLARELLGLVPLFAYLLPRMGTKCRDYQSLAKKIDSLTGGVGIFEQTGSKHGETSGILESMAIGSYCLKENTQDMIDLIKEMIVDFDFSDHKRVKMLLGVMHAQFESSVVGVGHSYAMRKAASPFSLVAWLTELWSGLDQANLFKQLKQLDDKLFADLNLLGEYFSQQAKQGVMIIAESNELVRAKNSLNSLTLGGNMVKNSFDKKYNLRHAYCTTTAVSFVAVATKVPDLEHVDSPALLVVSQLLHRSFFHNEIREKRGAYGGYARYDYNEGILYFSSYRDPHIVSTLETFGQAKKFIIEAEYTEIEIKEIIIALSAEIDKPATEVEQAKKAFGRELIGLSDETRKLFKDNLLKVTKDDVARVGEKYLRDNWQDYSVAVISSKEKIEAANKKLGELKLKIENI